ncbi:MAG: hypothetical protein IPO21_16950 [Bacteroidales bacterium]|nr:hypothetical protein [Bacteroidales bacterium]
MKLLKEEFPYNTTEYFDKDFKTKDEAIKYFTNHINSKIGSFLANILSEKYTLSDLWKRKEGHIITEDLILSELIPQTIFTYKKKRIDIEIHKLSETLKTITDIDESIVVMKKIKLFKNHQMIIAKDITSSSSCSQADNY